MSKRCLSFIITAIILQSCKGPQVVSFVNSKIDFGQFDTYRLISPADGENSNRTDSSAVDGEIQELLHQEMRGRNYEYRSKSDLRVQYHFVANNKTDIDVTPNYYSRNPFYSPYQTPYNSYNIRQRNFYEAILLVEIKDRKAKTIWQGSLDLRYTKKVKNKEDVLPNAVSKIFETYPYKAGSNKPMIKEEND